MHGHISKTTQKRAFHRLKILQGQLRGLERMVGEEKYCVDILRQSLAVQESLKSFDALMLENHLQVHVAGKLQKKERDRIVKEMIHLYRLHK